MKYVFMAVLALGTDSVVSLLLNVSQISDSILSLQATKGSTMRELDQKAGNMSLIKRTPPQPHPGADLQATSGRRQGSPIPRPRYRLPDSTSDTSRSSPGAKSVRNRGDQVIFTSPSRGWHGRSEGSQRNGSPISKDLPMFGTNPVEVQAVVKGPAVLTVGKISDSNMGREKSSYTVQAHETLEKGFSSPRKIKLKGQAAEGGHLEFTSTGRTVWSRIVKPENLRGNARSAGPGPQSKLAKWTTREKRGSCDYTKVTSPAPKPGPGQVPLVTGVVKTAADHPDGRVGAHVWAEGGKMVNIDAVISNSPSHSPPKSPGKLHPLSWAAYRLPRPGSPDRTIMR